MTASEPISAPGGFVPKSAVNFVGPGGLAVAVSGAAPLPVDIDAGPASSLPLGGTTSVSGSFGPFAPHLGRPIMLTLAGQWSGGVQLLRSTDGGATRLALTAGGQPWGSFTGNACEPVATESEAGASYWLDVSLASGTLSYRIAQ